MKHSRSTSAFTLVEVMIVVSIIGLLAAVSIPNYVKTREVSHRKACIANLKQLEGAVQNWALENRLNSGSGCYWIVWSATVHVGFSPTERRS